MPSPPTPLGGVVGFAVVQDPEATAAQRHGDVADPRHARVGEDAHPYPWEQFPGEPHGPYGLDNDLLGFDVCAVTMPAGTLNQDPTADMQPVTRAAPWPKNPPTTTDPDGTADWRAQTVEIHSENMGGSREALYEPTLDPVNDHWVEMRETDPGVMIPPLEEIPRQAKSGQGAAGWGTRDRTQSLARQNEYGFDSAHMHRRYADGSIPGNYMWLEPGARPLRKSVAGVALTPTGEGPFAGQDTGISYSQRGAILGQLPVAYDGPQEPATAPAYPAGDPAAVEYW